MTTRIHITNYGPDVVEIQTPQATPERIFPHQCSTVYVYDQHDVTVKEIKPDKI